MSFTLVAYEARGCSCCSRQVVTCASLWQCKESFCFQAFIDWNWYEALNISRVPEEFCTTMHLFCCIWSCFHLGPSTATTNSPLDTACTFLQFSARTFYAGKLLGYEWLERWSVRSRVIHMLIGILFVFRMFSVTRPLQRTPKDSLLEALTYWHIDTSTTNLRLKSGIKNEDRKQIRGAVGLVKIRLRKRNQTSAVVWLFAPSFFLYFVKKRRRCDNFWEWLKHLV